MAVTVGANEVIKAADSADEAAADIRQRAQNLVNDMLGRTSQFEGGAGTAFRNALGEFAEVLNRRILNRLETLSANTRTAANGLFSQDDIASAEIAASGNNFGGTGQIGNSGGHASGPNASPAHSGDVTAALS